MVGFILIAAVVVALAIFAALADRYGVDSRMDSTDPRRSPYPVGIEA
jgi:hypothetical protein